MSEGYVFSSASDVNDLLNQVVSQAVLHGWTQNQLETQSSLGRRGHISKDGVFINLCSMPEPSAGQTSATQLLDLVIPAEDRTYSANWAVSVGGGVWRGPDVLCVNVGTGHSSGTPWYRQPGADCNLAAANQGRFSAVRAKGAIGKVHMFFYENPAAIFVFIEPRAGEWHWFAAGMLAKDYSYSGGLFYGASMRDTNLTSAPPSSYSAIEHQVVHGDLAAGRGNNWGSSYQTYPEETAIQPNLLIPGYVGRSSIGIVGMSPVQRRGYDAANGRYWIQPPYAYANRAGGGNSYLGALPHTFYSTTEVFVGGEVSTIGGVEYMTFPFNWRTSPYDYSGNSLPALSLYWTRNNCSGAGAALRKPN